MEKNNQNKDFLQSRQWAKFQESVGRKTFHLQNDIFSASLIAHKLPMVGEYLYCPRGPVLGVKSQKSKVKSFLNELIDLAKKENAGWIRIEPENQEILNIIKENISEILLRRTEYRIVKAPHDMQPKEVFVLDIAKSEEELLAEMKPKTRYNINLAKKKNLVISNSSLATGDKKKYTDEFLRLTKEMATRHGIATHQEEYYRKMIDTLPNDMLKIYVAEFEGEIIAANLVLFFDGATTYLHGASGNAHRNLMAPFLLQWRAILAAKKVGCTKYDFGGVKTRTNTDFNGLMRKNDWEGITNFKLGFSPNTQPIEFPGSYDIIINTRKYAVYRGLQRAKAFAVKFRR